MEYDFEESVGYWVTISSLAFRRALNEDLAPHGITFRQSQVLGWLVLEGELSQADLACRMDVEAPTLKGLVDRMEVAGWVTRTDCEQDRRKKMIRPTPAAEPVWEKIAACARTIRRDATEGLSAVEVEQLRAYLKIVYENLNRRSSKTKAGSAAASDCQE